jgi:hypothetical protein
VRSASDKSGTHVALLMQAPVPKQGILLSAALCKPNTIWSKPYNGHCDLGVLQITNKQIEVIQTSMSFCASATPNKLAHLNSEMHLSAAVEQGIAAWSRLITFTSPFCKACFTNIPAALHFCTLSTLQALTSAAWEVERQMLSISR